METPLASIIATISATMGVAWASGINLYAVLLVLGLLGATGTMILPEHLQVLTHPAVILASGFMYLMEFCADKAPGVDSGWDAIHTFIRIPAGAVLAAGMVGQVDPALMVAAGVLGGTVTAGAHAFKAGGRILINASPEPFTNWTASVSEDLAAVGGVYLALTHPWIFLTLLVLFILLLVWLLPKMWQAIKTLFQSLARFFGAQPENRNIQIPASTDGRVDSPARPI